MKTIHFVVDHRGMRNVTDEPRMTQRALRAEIAVRAGLAVTSAQVRSVTRALVDDLRAAMRTPGARWRLPGLLTVIRRDLPPRPSRQVLNPFTKTVFTQAARPASARFRVKVDRGWRERWLFPLRVTLDPPASNNPDQALTGSVQVPTPRTPAQEPRRPQGSRALVAVLATALPAMTVAQVDAVLGAMRVALAEHLARDGMVSLHGLMRLGRRVREARPAGVFAAIGSGKAISAPAVPPRLDARGRLSGGLVRVLQSAH